MIQRFTAVLSAFVRAPWIWVGCGVACLFVGISVLLATYAPSYHSVAPVMRPWRQTILSMEQPPAVIALPKDVTDNPAIPYPMPDFRWQPFNTDVDGVMVLSGPALPWGKLNAMPQLRQLNLGHYGMLQFPYPQSNGSVASPSDQMLEQLRPISRLVQLTSLTLPACKLDSQLVASFETLRELRWLDVSHCDVESAASTLAELPVLPQLDTLVVKSLDTLTEATVQRLSKQPTLRRLVVLEQEIRGSHLQVSQQQLPRSLTEEDRATLMKLTRLRHLETLWVAGRDFSDAELAARRLLPHVDVRPYLINGTLQSGIKLLLVGLLLV